MPDWTYRTLLRPLLFCLPPSRAQSWALASLAQLDRLPCGPALIEFFGHMRADSRLAVRVAGCPFPGPVGIGSGLDPDGVALEALSRFGVGFVEVGPVGEAGPVRPEAIRKTEELLWTGRSDAISTARLADRLQARAQRIIPVIVRFAFTSVEATREAAATLHEGVSGYVVDVGHPVNASLVEAVTAAAGTKPVWVGLTADVTEPELDQIWPLVAAAGATGLWLTAERRSPDGRWVSGPAALPAVCDRIGRFRRRFGTLPSIAAGGAHTPADVLTLRQAGADLFVLDTGLVFSGPGLPKRVNEALLATLPDTSNANGIPAPAPGRSWFWLLLMGAGMFGGGLLAMAIASIRVVLPYDEVFCGMTRNQLAAVNPRLLAFMAHDRVTLAGTMIAAGVLYAGVAWNGVRRGRHWAKVAVAVSATSGFFSFFLFLGFGYFDPFHAFVSAILFQFLLLGLHSPLGAPAPVVFPDLSDSPAWKRGQWGQLLFVGLGIGLVGAGAVICVVGITRVFVPEDLEFMNTTAQALQTANPRLVPLVAHDRASLGGMLIACGLAVWLTAQWGFRAGERWLWWTLLLAGTPAFIAAIAVHLVVGYHSPSHLAPAFAGALGFAIALALSHGWLTEPESVRRAAWARATGAKNPSVN